MQRPPRRASLSCSMLRCAAQLIALLALAVGESRYLQNRTALFLILHGCLRVDVIPRFGNIPHAKQHIRLLKYRWIIVTGQVDSLSIFFTRCREPLFPLPPFLSCLCGCRGYGYRRCCSLAYLEKYLCGLWEETKNTGGLPEKHYKRVLRNSSCVVSSQCAVRRRGSGEVFCKLQGKQCLGCL